MKSEIREITPAVAAEMLKRNPNNRKVSRGQVDFLASEMTAGNWLFDGQPIRLTEAGALLDGQHRLHAIIKSGTTQKFLILKGIDESAFKVMDTGKSRSASDLFSINRIHSATNVAAASKYIIRLKRGTTSMSGSTSRESNTELLNFYNDNPKIADFVKRGDLLYKEFNRALSPSQIGALSYIMAERSVTDSEYFWNKLCSGIGLEKGSPIAFLRQKLLDDKYVNKAKLPWKDKVALIYKTWNHYRKGTTQVNYIRWDKNTEKFPEII